MSLPAREPSVRDEQRAFLAALFTGVPGRIEIRAIHEHAGARTRFADSIDAALAKIEELYRPGWNLYVGVATRRSRGRGKKADLAHTRMLFVDYDGDPETLNVLLDGSPWPPSMIVDSGGGRHLYFRLDETVALDEEGIATVEATMRGLTAWFGGDRACCDATRILRVPGTTNWPNAKKRAGGRMPRSCRVAVASSRVNSLDDFSVFTESGHRQQKTRRQPERRAALRAPERQGRISPTAAAVRAQHPRLADLWRLSGKAIGDTSPSGYQWSLALVLLQAGLAPDQVVEALIVHRNEIHAAGLAQFKPASNAVRTVAKAQAFIAANPPERVGTAAVHNDQRQAGLSAAEAAVAKGLLPAPGTRLRGRFVRERREGDRWIVTMEITDGPRRGTLVPFFAGTIDAPETISLDDSLAERQRKRGWRWSALARSYQAATGRRAPDNLYSRRPSFWLGGMTVEFETSIVSTDRSGHARSAGDCYPRVARFVRAVEGESPSDRQRNGRALAPLGRERALHPAPCTAPVRRTAAKTRAIVFGSGPLRGVPRVAAAAHRERERIARSRVRAPDTSGIPPDRPDMKPRGIDERASREGPVRPDGAERRTA